MKKILDWLTWKKVLLFLVSGIVLYAVTSILEKNVEGFPNAVAIIFTIVAFLPIVLLLIRLVLSLYVDNKPKE